MAALLEAPGRTIHTCADIESAQMLVETNTYRAIFADVRLTGEFAFEGLEFIRHVRKYAPESRIVVMTGFGSQAMQNEALARGASGFLLKPFSANEIEELVGPAPASHAKDEAITIAVPSLESILASDELYPVFHPIVRLSERGEEVVAYEALTRLASDSPLANPELLFRYAARKEATEELDLRCIENALREGAGLAAHTSLFLNVNPATISSPCFAERLRRIAGVHGVSLEHVVLELTEHGRIEEIDACLRNVELLRTDGVRFAFDDLGSAYSHLPHIRAIRPAFVKASQEFGTGFERDDSREKIVRNIAALAADFDCELIVEGIETAETAAAARAAGYQLLQGYLYGKPARAATFFAATA